MKEYQAIKRDEVVRKTYTSSIHHFNVTLIHEPTGIYVTKNDCKSHIRDVEPMYDELDGKVMDYLMTN